MVRAGRRRGHPGSRFRRLDYVQLYCSGPKWWWCRVYHPPIHASSAYISSAHISSAHISSAYCYAYCSVYHYAYRSAYHYAYCSAYHYAYCYAYHSAETVLTIDSSSRAIGQIEIEDVSSLA